MFIFRVSVGVFEARVRCCVFGGFALPVFLVAVMSSRLVGLLTVKAFKP